MALPIGPNKTRPTERPLSAEACSPISEESAIAIDEIVEEQVGHEIDSLGIGQRAVAISETLRSLLQRQALTDVGSGVTPPVNACAPWDANLVPQIRQDPALQTEIRKLEATYADLKGEQAAAMGGLETHVHQALREIYEIPENLQGEFSHTVYGIMGDQMENAGANRKAQEFFEKAASLSETVADYYWYRLREIRQRPPKELAKHRNILVSMRNDLQWMKTRLVDGPVLDGPVEDYFESEVWQYGSLEKLHAVDALLWGLLFDAELSQETPDFQRIDRLDGARRRFVALRRFDAGPLEQRLHWDNLLRTTTVATMSGGRVEQLLRGTGREAAEQRLALQEEDLRPFAAWAEKEETFRESLADLSWRTAFDGTFSLDRPAEALRKIESDFLPRFGDTEAARRHLIDLQEAAPHLFNARGNLITWLDYSETELGAAAASRTRSAYWVSHDTFREAGLPIGTGLAGAAGGFLMCHIPCALIGGFAGGGTGSGANLLYNIHTDEAKASAEESSITGLSRVDDHRAYLNKTYFGWTAGFNALAGSFFAFPAMGGVVFAKSGSQAALTAVATRGGWGATALQTGRAGWNIARHPLSSGRALSQVLGNRVLRIGEEGTFLDTGRTVTADFFKTNFQNIPGGKKWAAIRLGVGSGLMLTDWVEPDLPYVGQLGKRGVIDNVMGAFGAAIFINEGAGFLLNTDPNGLLIGNLLKVATEWGMQVQQDMPLSQPDPNRLMWASGETAFMIFFAKGLVRGEQFYKTFSIGRGALKVRNSMVETFPWTEGVFTASANRGYRHPDHDLIRVPLKRGEDSSMINFARASKIPPVRLTKKGMVELPDGTIFPQSQAALHADRLKNFGIRVGKGNRLSYRRVRHDLISAILKPGENTNGDDLGPGLSIPKVTLTKQNRVELPDGKTFPLSEARQHMRELNDLGIVVETSQNGRIARSVFGSPETSNSLRFWRPRFSTKFRVPLLGRNFRKGEKLTPEEIQLLHDHGVRIVADGGFEVRRYSGIEFKGVRETATGEKVIDWELKPKRIEILDKVTIGGLKMTLWYGTSMSRPHFTTAGGALVAAHTGTAAYVTNKYFFSRAMNGDPEYQPLQRASNYFTAELLTHPHVQWPLGYDTPLAQGAGRLIGIPMNLGLNMFFRTYSEQWPGSVTYFQALENGQYRKAFDNLTGNMTTLDIVPFWKGNAGNDFFLWEARAIATFREIHDKISRNNPLEIWRHTAAMFREMCRLEADGDLSLRDRRGLRFLAVYFNSQLHLNPVSPPAYLEPVQTLREEFPSLFRGIPAPHTDAEWAIFMENLNRDEDTAADFHLYLKN